MTVADGVRISVSFARKGKLINYTQEIKDPSIISTTVEMVVMDSVIMILTVYPKSDGVSRIQLHREGLNIISHVKLLKSIPNTIFLHRTFRRSIPMI